GDCRRREIRRPRLASVHLIMFMALYTCAMQIVSSFLPSDSSAMPISFMAAAFLIGSFIAFIAGSDLAISSRQLIVSPCSSTLVCATPGVAAINIVMTSAAKIVRIIRSHPSFGDGGNVPPPSCLARHVEDGGHRLPSDDAAA